ncbi:MAG: Epoxyqueuosine reductase [Firmicutes bacterium]|nr:Epoxyqueuosine reductase [Bacillota bacterium]MDI6704927.1 tRNA epoxyqueuosine(34) reductase QueG [Bacillota bacterium]
MITREEIRKTANEIGLDLVGFTHAGELERIREILEERERCGYLSGMEPGSRDDRICPGLHLEDVKSIIAVGLSYKFPPGGCEKQGDCPKGVLSGFAVGEDYHRVIESRLEQLALYIKSRIKGFRYSIMVDTGPLVDREVAYRAGIGWYGKNCSIICPGFGSGILLGEMLTNIELEPDTPGSGECGACTLCIDTCPTGALIAPYTLNAKKCISYLTQMRGIVPRELRPKMGTSIYGCDRCQQACPHNRDTISFKDRDNAIDLIELLQMDKREFNKKFGTRSLAWRGLNVLKRNAVIALGNFKKEEGLDILASISKHPSPMLRAHAAWAVGRIGGSRAVRILQNMLDCEKDADVRSEAELSLKEVRERRIT